MSPEKRTNRTAWLVGILICCCFVGFMGCGEVVEKKPTGEVDLCVDEVMVVLHGRVLEDLLAVGVEPEVPEADRRHEAVRLLGLAVGAEEGLDELDAGVLAQVAIRLCLGARPEHGRLTSLEQLPELVSEAVTGFDELLNHLPVFLGPDPGHGVLGALYLPG